MFLQIIYIFNAFFKTATNNNFQITPHSPYINTHSEIKNNIKRKTTAHYKWCMYEKSTYKMGCHLTNYLHRSRGNYSRIDSNLSLCFTLNNPILQLGLLTNIIFIEECDIFHDAKQKTRQQWMNKRLYKQFRETARCRHKLFL